MNRDVLVLSREGFAELIPKLVLRKASPKHGINFIIVLLPDKFYELLFFLFREFFNIRLYFETQQRA
jgi:hypothetical protein